MTVEDYAKNQLIDDLRRVGEEFTEHQRQILNSGNEAEEGYYEFAYEHDSDDDAYEIIHHNRKQRGEGKKVREMKREKVSNQINKTLAKLKAKKVHKPKLADTFELGYSGLAEREKGLESHENDADLGYRETVAPLAKKKKAKQVPKNEPSIAERAGKLKADVDERVRLDVSKILQATADELSGEGTMGRVELFNTMTMMIDAFHASPEELDALLQEEVSAYKRRIRKTCPPGYTRQNGACKKRPRPTAQQRMKRKKYNKRYRKTAKGKRTIQIGQRRRKMRGSTAEFIEILANMVEQD